MPLHDCSIITLAHNGRQFSTHFIESLLSADDKPQELFLIDNASSDGTAALIEEMTPRIQAAGIRLVTWRNRENKGCSQARNEAWEKVQSTYVVFMDNDAAVRSPQWLTRLTGHMESDSQFGILGPKILYPYKPHLIQCAGVGMTPLGRIWFRGRGRPAEDPRFNLLTDVPMLISACWMMRNDLRSTVGYLDELFHPVQYEDLDLCLRALQAGYRVAYTPDVEMYHFEGITTESPGRVEYQRNIARNSIKFRQKWNHLYASLGTPVDPDDLRWLSREEMGLTLDLDLEQR